MPSVVVGIVVVASLVMSVGLNVHRARVLRAVGRPIPTSLKISFFGSGIAAVGLVVLLVATLYGL